MVMTINMYLASALLYTSSTHTQKKTENDVISWQLYDWWLIDVLSKKNYMIDGSIYIMVENAFTVKWV